MNEGESNIEKKPSINKSYLILSILLGILLSFGIVYIINKKYSKLPLKDQYSSLILFNKPIKNSIN
jgi:hypothetical protein